MLPISLARATPDAEVLATLKSAISESESPATDLAGVQDLLLSLPELSAEGVAKFDAAMKAEKWDAAVDAAQALAESAGRTLTLDEGGVDEAKDAKKDFVLWIKHPQHHPVWIKHSSHSNPDRLVKERMDRRSRGYDTSILRQGNHPDDVGASLESVDEGSMFPRNYDRAIRKGAALYAKKYRAGPDSNATIRQHAKYHAEHRVLASKNASYGEIPTETIASAHTGHWFSPATKKFFKSRVSDWAHTGPGGTFFVSSEKPPHGPRHYSVRHYQDPSPGGIKTAGKFGAHTTSSEAQRWAAKYAKGTHLPPTLESGDDFTAHLVTEARAATEKILPVLDTQQPFIASLLTQFDEAASNDDLATVIETSRKLFAAAEEADTTVLDNIEEAAIAEMRDVEELTTSGTTGGFASAPLGYDDATADDTTDDEDAEQGEDADDDEAEAEHLLKLGGIGGAGNGGMDPNDSARDAETTESTDEAKHPLPYATSWPNTYDGKGKEYVAKHGTYQIVPNAYNRTKQGVRKPAKAMRARFISHATGSEWQDLGHADSLTAATQHARSHFDATPGASLRGDIRGESADEAKKFSGPGGTYYVHGTEIHNPDNNRVWKSRDHKSAVAGARELASKSHGKEGAPRAFNTKSESTLPQILLTLADSDLHREIAHQVAEWASRNVPNTDVTQFLAESGLRDEALDESLTRKHFKGLADIVKQHKGKLTDEQHKSLATHLAAWASGHNPNFDRSKFMHACGRPTNEAIEETTARDFINWTGPNAPRNVHKGIDLNAVSRGYHTAALWSSHDYDENGNNGEPLDAKHSVNDIHPKTRASGDEDIHDFVSAQHRHLKAAKASRHGYSDEHIGHDFWLSRNGHGAGFFDRGNEPHWNHLQAATKPYGGVDLYSHEGTVYAHNVNHNESVEDTTGSGVDEDTYLSRDPFARTELHREVAAKKGSSPEAKCDWCGTSSNDRTLYKYRTENDGLRNTRHEHKGIFCGRGCHKSYHNESVLADIQADLDEAAELIEAGAVELPVEVTGANSGLQFTIEADGSIIDADPQILEAINDDGDLDETDEGSMFPRSPKYAKARERASDVLKLARRANPTHAHNDIRRVIAKATGSANVKEDTGQGATDPTLRFVDLDLGDEFSFVDAANSPRLAGTWVKTSYRSYRDAGDPNAPVLRTPATQVPVVRVGGDGDVTGVNNPNAGNGLPDGYDGDEGADIGADVEEGFIPLTDEASQLPRGKRFKGARLAAAKDALAARNRNPKNTPRQKFAQNQYVRHTVIRNKGRDPQAYDHPLLKAARSAYKSIHRGVNSLMKHRDSAINRNLNKYNGWPNKDQVRSWAAESVNEGLSDNANEMVLHADNDRTLHNGSFVPIVRNLSKRVSKGDYDHEKAKKLWGYHADRAAQSYHKQYGDSGSKWHQMFSPADRKEAASHWADREYENIKNGEYRHEAEEGDDYADPVGEGNFGKLASELSHKGVRDPKALAAWIGRKKLGKAEFQRRAEAGRHAHEGDESDDLDGQVEEASRSHKYRGSWIHPAQSADKKRQGYHWYIEKTHNSGVPYGHESSPHHRTLGDAKAAIDDQHKDRASYESSATASTVTFAESKMDEFSALAKEAGVPDDATVTMNRDAKTVTVTLTAEQVEALDGKLPTADYAIATL